MTLSLYTAGGLNEVLHAHVALVLFVVIRFGGHLNVAGVMLRIWKHLDVAGKYMVLILSRIEKWKPNRISY